MKITYNKPPIKEAVCEFRFDKNSEWDLTYPGLIYSELKESFPEKQSIQGMEINIDAINKQVSQQLIKAERINFRNTEKNELINLAQNLISFHKLRPYQGWDNFLPILRKVYNSYIKVATNASINRIGLRYINQIQLKENQNISDLFEFRPFYKEGFPGDMKNFSMITESSFEEINSQSKIQIKKNQNNVIFFDIDIFTNSTDNMEVKDIFEWVENAHSKIIEIFEASITDKLRKKFEIG